MHFNFWPNLVLAPISFRGKRKKHGNKKLSFRFFWPKNNFHLVLFLKKTPGGGQHFLMGHPRPLFWSYTNKQQGCRHSSVDLLRLQSSRHRFESQAHHLCFYQFKFESYHMEKTKINIKSGRDWPLKTIEFYSSFNAKKSIQCLDLNLRFQAATQH